MVFSIWPLFAISTIIDLISLRILLKLYKNSTIMYNLKGINPCIIKKYEIVQRISIIMRLNKAFRKRNFYFSS